MLVMGSTGKPLKIKVKWGETHGRFKDLFAGWDWSRLFFGGVGRGIPGSKR